MSQIELNSMTKEIMENVSYEAIGAEIAELLGLKRDKAGFYKTAYGKKTTIGLGKMVQTIVDHATAIDVATK